MLDRPEFGVNDKVSFWNGTSFNTASVMNLNLNPISGIVEYKLFYRVPGSNGKRNRVTVTTTPMYIKESVHFKGAKNV
jgi:hypothetical protein